MMPDIHLIMASIAYRALWYFVLQTFLEKLLPYLKLDRICIRRPAGSYARKQTASVAHRLEYFPTSHKFTLNIASLRVHL